MAKNKEWEKEMMKWSKQNLINLLEKVISERKQQQTSVSGLQNVRFSFAELTEKILKYNAKSEYQQASIIILRNIFEAHEA